jgi:hypothetical protein
VKKFLLSGLLVFFPFTIFAADEGFDSSETGEGFSSVSGVSIGGELGTEFLVYAGGGFESYEKIKAAELGDLFSGKLNFAVSGANADGVINLKLAPVFDGSGSPITFDEAYTRAYIGSLDIEGGLRKLTWGRADSMGPLDVINPLDYSDLSSITDQMDRKIARPLIRVSYWFDSFSKLEGVFVPWFQGNRYALTGRWASSQIKEMPSTVRAALAPALAGLPPALAGNLQSETDALLSQESIEALYADDAALRALEYAQAGLRFTATIGSADIGIQYFYGNLPRPAVDLSGVEAFLANPGGVISGGTVNAAALEGLKPVLRYNRYHQIGLDYAQVLGGFNIRAEAAANITGDLSGDDGAVYNPFLAWSLGFDRDLLWEINMNLQGVGTVRLLDDKVGGNIFTDTEAGTKMSSTRITLALSKKFFKDELELKATGLWGIEDMDFYILPALIWTKEDIALEISGGVFGGDGEGELGQYRSSSFGKVLLTYTF